MVLVYDDTYKLGYTQLLRYYKTGSGVPGVAYYLYYPTREIPLVVGVPNSIFLFICSSVHLFRVFRIPGFGANSELDDCSIVNDGKWNYGRPGDSVAEKQRSVVQAAVPARS